MRKFLQKYTKTLIVCLAVPFIFILYGNSGLDKLKEIFFKNEVFFKNEQK